MNIKECIALIKEMKRINFVDDSDKDKLLKDIVPVVTGLRKGKELMKSIKAKVYKDEYDKAALFLKKAARHSKYWPLSDVKWSDLGSTRIMIIIFMCGGLINILYWYLDARHTKDSADWPSTTGIVMNTRIIENTDDDDYITGYSPRIEYTYTIYGIPYNSNNYSFSSEEGEYNWADSIIKQHPVNSLIEVYYHPEKHRMSVLNPGFDPFSYVLVIFGYGIFLAALIIMYFKVKKQINRIKESENKKK